MQEAEGQLLQEPQEVLQEPQALLQALPARRRRRRASRDRRTNPVLPMRRVLPAQRVLRPAAALPLRRRVAAHPTCMLTRG